MPAKPRNPARKPAKKLGARHRAPKPRPAKPTSKADPAGVRAWLSSVKPEHRALVKRIDRVLRSEIPDVVATIKFRKPSQPEGVPFYGRPGYGWIAAMWSFKARVTVGFFGGVELDPPPPRSQGARTRLVDYSEAAQVDEKQLRAWVRQAARVQGWAKV